MHKGTQGGLKLNFFLSPDTLGEWAHIKISTKIK